MAQINIRSGVRVHITKTWDMDRQIVWRRTCSLLMLKLAVSPPASLEICVACISGHSSLFPWWVLPAQCMASPQAKMEPSSGWCRQFRKITKTAVFPPSRMTYPGSIRFVSPDYLRTRSCREPGGCALHRQIGVTLSPSAVPLIGYRWSANFSPANCNTCLSTQLAISSQEQDTQH